MGNVQILWDNRQNLIFVSLFNVYFCWHLSIFFLSWMGTLRQIPPFGFQVSWWAWNGTILGCFSVSDDKSIDFAKVNYFPLPHIPVFLLLIYLFCFCSPRTVAAFERKCIDDSMTHAISIVVNTLPKHTKYLDVLMRILDPATQYYVGWWIVPTM